MSWNRNMWHMFPILQGYKRFHLTLILNCCISFIIHFMGHAENHRNYWLYSEISWDPLVSLSDLCLCFISVCRLPLPASTPVWAYWKHRKQRPVSINRPRPESKALLPRTARWSDTFTTLRLLPPTIGLYLLHRRSFMACCTARRTNATTETTRTSPSRSDRKEKTGSGEDVACSDWLIWLFLWLRKTLAAFCFEHLQWTDDGNSDSVAPPTLSPPLSCYKYLLVLFSCFQTTPISAKHCNLSILLGFLYSFFMITLLFAALNAINLQFAATPTWPFDFFTSGTFSTLALPV